MTDFNIRRLIRDVLRSSTTADPGDVAREVLGRIPDEHLRDALAQVLREVVRESMRSERLDYSFNTSDGSKAATPPIRSTGPTPLYSAPTPQDRDPEKPRTPNRSVKVQAIRDGWQKRLTDRIHVGADAGGWKMLRNCTYEDLLFAAQERRDIADKNAIMARQFDSYARLLTEHDVPTFGDLPAEALMSALGRAA